MEELPFIENLSSFFNQKVVNQTATRLTAAGDNYGSTMLKLDIELEDGKTVHTVAKMLPKEEFMRKIFSSDITFKGEIEFYKTIVPTMQNFRKSCGLKPMDYFADFIGGRTNLNNDDNGGLDDQAVLILANLRVIGYTMAVKNEGFDYDTTVLILEKLAQFHATGIALKQKRPDIFSKRILPLFKEIKLFNGSPEFQQITYNQTFTEVDRDQTLSKYKERIKSILDKTYEFFDNHPRNLKHKDLNNSWPTIVHTDAWVNNILIKSNNGKYDEVKFVDFQVFEFESPVKDVIFFMLSSTQNQVLEEHFNDLLKLYHKKFVEELRLLDSYKKDFSYANYEKELKDHFLEYELTHTLLMLFPIFLEEGAMNGKPDPDNVVFPEKLQKRTEIVLKKCVEKGWFS